MKKLFIAFCLTLLSNTVYAHGIIFVDPVINSTDHKVRGFVYDGDANYNFPSQTFEDAKVSYDVKSTQIGATFEMPISQSKDHALWGQIATIDIKERINSLAHQSRNWKGGGYTIGIGGKSILFKNGRSSLSVVGNFSHTKWEWSQSTDIWFAGADLKTKSLAKINSLTLASYYNYRSSKAITIFGGASITPIGNSSIQVTQSQRFGNINGSHSFTVHGNIIRPLALETGVQMKYGKMNYDAKLSLTEGTSISLGIGRSF